MFRRFVRRVQAHLRLSQRAICEESRGRGLYDDFHDYSDTAHGQPSHFEDLQCRHCGKLFRM